MKVMKMNQDKTSDIVGISINKDDIKVTFPYHYFKDEQKKILKKLEIIEKFLKIFI